MISKLFRKALYKVLFHLLIRNFIMELNIHLKNKSLNREENKIQRSTEYKIPFNQIRICQFVTNTITFDVYESQLFLCEIITYSDNTFPFKCILAQKVVYHFPFLIPVH